MRRLTIPRLALYFAGMLTLIAMPPACSPAPSERRLGFTAAAFAVERQAETRLMASVSTDAISETHRALTGRPHPAGSDGSRQVTEYLERELALAGLEVQRDEYTVHLSRPRNIRIDLVTPVSEPLAVMEPADPRDPSTAHPDLDPGYIAYSPSGSVTAPVVFVNYGLPPDYAALQAKGVDVKGRIVLARYGRSHRAVKVYTAEQAGAAGVILYSDPADDGSGRGVVWPDGLWRAPDLVQRGNAKYSWLWHGDPLTPGIGARDGVQGIAPESAPTLPKIPAAALSAREAEKIKRYDGRATVRLHVEMENGPAPIRNVIGRLAGAGEPDRWVILGTHHDAWTFGGIDPGSSAAVILEVARRLGDLRRSGWQPARSILFAFWDAEEYGLVGSTEYAEAHARELQERAVVYLNSDMYTPGRFVAGGVPSLRDFVAEIARDLPEAARSPAADATAPRSLFESWRETEWSRQPAATRSASAESHDVELSALGSGADFVAFQDHLGLPTLALEFLFEGGYGFGAYHSSYDTRFYMERVADPDFAHGALLARVLGVATMRLAAAPVLPFRHSHYAERIRSFLESAATWGAGSPGTPALSVDTMDLQALASEVAARARGVEQAIDAALNAGEVPAAAVALNDRLARLEQTLIDATEPPDRRWFRHVVWGWNIYSMYDGQPLPDLADAIRRRDEAAVARERERIRRALQRMRDGVEAIASLLPRTTF